MGVFLMPLNTTMLGKDFYIRMLGEAKDILGEQGSSMSEAPLLLSASQAPPASRCPGRCFQRGLPSRPSSLRSGQDPL